MSDSPESRPRGEQPAAPARSLPSLGRYRHYKGGEYSVIGFARHSETDERLVLYIPLYGDGECWARPVSMFCGDVEQAGRLIPRFQLIRALENS